MGGRTSGRSVGVEAALRRALLRWHDRHRRDLPWRENRDPYRVWVAEVMLQQTRIAVVEPAYVRFLRAFPSLERLAAANEEDIVAQWSGLGYYSRARSLHRAARQLAAAGETFPRDYAAARKVPGVGAYTSAAVLSIAYGEPHAAVDGNVVRVLSRLRRLQLPDSRGEPHASFAHELLSLDRPGDWNEAIMELGETVCTPVNPRCEECPISEYCEAHRADVVARHPPAKKRRATEKVEATMVVVRDRSGDLALERGAFPYLPKMWLPLLERDAVPKANDKVGEIRHAITHRTFRIRVIARRVSGRDFGDLLVQCGASTERRAFSTRELQTVGRSSLLRKALEV